MVSYQRQKIFKFSLAIIVAILILFQMLLPIFAEGGQGNGAGSGTGLALMSAVFANGTKIDGAQGVACSQQKLKFMFNKNVNDDAVWEKNKACFSITDPSGRSVNIEVSRITGSPSSDEKRYIYVTLKEDLKPGTAYSIRIGAELTAKNLTMKIGDGTGGQDVVLGFHTVAPTETASTANSNAGAATPAAGGAGSGNAAASQSTGTSVQQTRQGQQPDKAQAPATTETPGSSKPAATIDAQQTNDSKKSDKGLQSTKNQQDGIPGGEEGIYWLVAAVFVAVAAVVAVMFVRSQWLSRKRKLALEGERIYLWGLRLREAVGCTLFGVLIAVTSSALHMPLHIPGHKGLLNMAILTACCLLYAKPGAGTLAGCISGFVAVIIGIEGKGLLGFFNYFLPGLFMDFFICVIPFLPKRWYTIALASGIAYLAKLFSNYLTGIILNVPMGFLSVGLKVAGLNHLIFGALGGVAGYLVYKKTPVRKFISA